MEGGGGGCFDECNFEKGLTWSWKEEGLSFAGCYFLEGHHLVMEGVGGSCIADYNP